MSNVKEMRDWSQPLRMLTKKDQVIYYVWGRFEQRKRSRTSCTGRHRGTSSTKKALAAGVGVGKDILGGATKGPLREDPTEEWRKAATKVPGHVAFKKGDRQKVWCNWKGVKL